MSNSDDYELIETFIPDDPSIDKFHSLSVKEKLKIIKLGLVVTQECNEKIQLWNDCKWQKTIDSLKTSSNEKIDMLKNTISQIKTKHEEYCKIANTQQSALINNAIQAEKQIHLKEVTSLRKTNSELIEKIQNIHSTLEEKYNARNMKQTDKYDEKIESLRLSMEEMRNNYEERLSRNQNSNLKGKDGEVFVFGKLNMMFPSADIEDTHNIPHRGDFIMRLNEITMMIETKNYSRNVQKSEVDKFYRDIDNPANNDIQCAVFVSLNTGICNKEDFQFEIRNMIPILFIHNLIDNFDSLFLVIKFFKLIIEQSQIDLTNKQVIDVFKNIATTIKRNFSKQKSILDKYHAEQTQLIITQQSNIADLYGIVKQKF